MKDHAGHAAHATHSGPAGSGLGGLAISTPQYALHLTRTRFEAGREDTLRFQVHDASGRPVREFDLTHERRMHLIVVRRDFAHYQHLHPELADDGTWNAPVRFPAAGFYRAFADFVVDSQPQTLGADLAVPGTLELADELPVSTRAATGEYEVALAASLDGSHRMLELEVRRRGAPVSDLEPYLGALGHLVALREGDLAFLHVHPQHEHAARAGVVRFHAPLPPRSRYRLFFEFRHHGEVRTVSFAFHE